MTHTKNNFRLYGLAAILITANIVTLLLMWLHRFESNDEHRGRMPGGGPQLFEYISRELHFDQKQKDTYALLRDNHHAGAKLLQDSIKNAKDQLFSMLQQTNIAEEAITIQSNKAAALTSQLDVFTFHHFQKVRALCNTEQQKIFDRIIQEAIHTMAQPPGRPAGERP